MPSQELFLSGEFHATRVLPSVATGSDMAARDTGLVNRTGLLFDSDYSDPFDTQEKGLPFDRMFVCFRVLSRTFGAAHAMKVWTI